MSVQSVSEEETVTLVTGCETFSLPAEEVAEELRKTCAGTTSGERTAVC